MLRMQTSNLFVLAQIRIFCLHLHIMYIHFNLTFYNVVIINFCVSHPLDDHCLDVIVVFYCCII